jgi:copper resistance protein C
MRKLCLLTKSSPAMTTNKWLTLAFVAALSAFRADMAGAHALLDHADPRVGNTVKNPRMVSLWFTQNLEGSFSGIEVLDANGQPVNTGRAVVDSNDRKLLRVPVKALPAGTYTVRWHVLSVDTHTTQGNFTFRVEP